MAQLWEVLGGADTGGILVREGKALASAASGRLSTGALVEELELEGGRLHYKRKTGTGPEEGWISIALQSKVLAQRTSNDKLASAADASAEEALPEEEEEEQVPGGEGELPQWVQNSEWKMQAFRDKTKVLPPDLNQISWPLRLWGQHPREKLPPFKRLSHKEMADMSVKNLPGAFSGMKFPHNSEQLMSFGPQWYTEAFHTMGTLPEDNRVTKVVQVKQLPHSGFDAAGGAGHKAFVTLEYEKPDPNLHTKLFAKMPWDYFESNIGKQYRMQISTYSDMDSLEVLTSICMEHLLPFRIPKFYFGDINRDTTNYVLIVERIPFSKRGKVVDGRVVEKIERKPFQVLPVCGKYQDYLLEDPPKIYYALFREMAHLAAWDQQGHYDYFLGPADKFTKEQFLEFNPRKAMKAKRAEIQASGAKGMTEKGIDFALNVAPWLFTAAGRDRGQLEKMLQEIVTMAPHFDDIRTFIGSSSDYIAAMHMNLQADNAYFWADSYGELDVGVFDWCGFNRVPFVNNFMGCLSGAEADMLDEHEEGLMRIFCDEYERYGGPHLEWQDLLLRYRLLIPSFCMDSCQWVERDMYVETPREEWKTIKSKFDEKFISRWNTRCRGTTLINAFDYYPRRDFKRIFDEWREGVGKPFITPYTA